MPKCDFNSPVNLLHIFRTRFLRNTSAFEDALYEKLV